MNNSKTKGNRKLKYEVEVALFILIILATIAGMFAMGALATYWGIPLD